MLRTTHSIPFLQFVSQNGLSEFMYDLETYDSNSNYEDDGTEFPTCEAAGDYGYIGLDCASDGSFAINKFSDQYCQSRTGNSYDTSTLSNVNSLLSNYKKCTGAYSSGDSTDDSLVHKLVYYSEPCTSLDYDVCEDSAAFESRSASSGVSKNPSSKNSKWSSNGYMGSRKSWVTKLKYVVGGMFLLASFIMFTGILFTNRRRRRAMMMRKYRQSKKDKSRSGGESRKSRSGSKSKRTKSKDKGRDGVLT